MYQINITKDELSAGITQLGARLDDLKKIQIKHGQDGNIKRVIELEEFIKPIRSLYDKLMEVYCK